jgi:hypothetical protein
MNEVELLALGDALARTLDVLQPGEHVAFQVSVDGRPVDGPESTVPVTADSRVVLLSAAGAQSGRAHPGRGPADLLELRRCGAMSGP